MGDGMAALFTLKTGYRIDTGEVDAAGTTLKGRDTVR